MQKPRFEGLLGDKHEDPFSIKAGVDPRGCARQRDDGGIEALADNQPVIAALSAISHADTSDAVMMERAVLRGLGGTCHSPIAALALVQGDRLFLRAEIISPDGQETVREEARLARGDLAAGEALGELALEEGQEVFCLIKTNALRLGPRVA